MMGKYDVFQGDFIPVYSTNLSVNSVLYYTLFLECY